ncbi:uncharacterized protein MYCFIDRAFT_45479 [Pseudocercospora fijiensis CIRAD86]|uniref:FAD dependent oxidoreductase domain-containing protein n=1 Tax=Pseudocercospora fijiensis (strain CIRAD86) TaxID=383855 RepID=M3A5D0_PSEFD|nr:uncharacterized protein MYCFIDRAFT_45479 [Pseudocercospora fijiensis CIRAD86]EME86329.1 hypothetical protein MYCFIDRAFT_45479 [Pseudocercospora fijiensis CIRAD86]
MTSNNKSYVIVGAGVFGVSTAYHLKKQYPNADITIVDRDAYDADSRVAASWDWNKVVRADYDDIVYCQLALESQDVFKSDPLWKPYFHETGIYWICRDDYADKVIDNYKKLGRRAELQSVSIEDAKKMHNGLFDLADYDRAKSVLVNKTSGWAAAGDCLRAVTKWCLDQGIKYEVAEVASLQFSGDRCVGVRTTTGKTISGDQIILSSGAYTPKLLELAAQASGNIELRAGRRITAAGITTGMTTLKGKDIETFADMPVGVQGYTAATGPFIGSLPPTKDNELKWWGQTIFENTQELFPGRWVSYPPPKQDYGQWDASRRMREDIDHANHVFYGKKGANWQMEKYRVCWDAFTTDADFIISPHSAAKGLYVATCGNFHGWKFFPVIGKYVAQMLDGKLSPELAQKWAWDRARPDPSENADYPRAQLSTLLDPVRTSKL